MKSLLATCLLTFAVVFSAAAVDVDEIIDRAERAFTHTRIIIRSIEFGSERVEQSMFTPDYLDQME